MVKFGQGIFAPVTINFSRVAACPAARATPPGRAEDVGLPTLTTALVGRDLFTVRVVQTFLNTWVDRVLEVDGRYGPKTAAAVRDFQVSRGLLADGIVGKQTWAQMFCEGGRGFIEEVALAVVRDGISQGIAQFDPNRGFISPVPTPRPIPRPSPTPIPTPQPPTPQPPDSATLLIIGALVVGAFLLSEER